MEEKKVQADSGLIIWLVSMLVLGIGILLGVFIAKRTRKKETHIRELEEQLSQSREELAEYRAQVDDYLITTSELVDQLTASYRAVYMHLAEGAQTLCERDYEAAHLKLAGSDFFDTLPTDPEQETNDTRTPAEEELVSGIAGEGVEAVSPGNVTDEVGEDKAVMAEESVTAEFSEVTEPDEQGATEKTEPGATDVEVRDEKENT
jgi:uncharacterized membrane-anchored protein YhcB (DUF1043 family)